MAKYAFRGYSMADTDFDRMKVMLGERYPVWLAAHAKSLNRKITRFTMGTNEERKKLPKIRKILKVVTKEMKQMGLMT